MTERHLHRGLNPLSVGGHGRYECGRRCAEVGAERQRVHPLDGDEPDADEGRDGGGEDRARLHQERENGPSDDGDVPSQPGEVGEIRVEGFSDQLGDRPCEKFVRHPVLERLRVDRVQPLRSACKTLTRSTRQLDRMSSDMMSMTMPMARSPMPENKVELKKNEHFSLSCMFMV